MASLFDDLKFFSGGLKGLDADALRLRLAIGLDREVLPAEVEEPQARKVRKLLDRLKDDRELSGMVRLARNLMAIVHLPRPLDVPDEMPVGGVSDISQRGTLDRLLISELAQERSYADAAPGDERSALLTARDAAGKPAPRPRDRAR